MRVVLDVNVWVSALISRLGAPARIVAHWQAEEFEVAISPAILRELDRVLNYPRLQEHYHLPEKQVQGFLRLVTRQATEVAPSQPIHAIERDSTDNRHLECALAAGAEVIVSGDRHLLELGQYEGVQILTPAGFLALLQLQGQHSSLERGRPCMSC